jgi:hypothetical protein
VYEKYHILRRTRRNVRHKARQLADFLFDCEAGRGARVKHKQKLCTDGGLFVSFVTVCFKKFEGKLMRNCFEFLKKVKNG